jgi:hypothetical protein
MPGTGGAPEMAGAFGPSEGLPTMGEDRSLTCVTFFSLAPLPISDSSAPCALLAAALHHAGSHIAASRCSFRVGVNILFLPPTVASRPVPSYPALEAVVAALPRLVPWAAWAEEEVVGASCRVRPRRMQCSFSCSVCIGSLYGVLVPGLVCRSEVR